MYVPTPIDRYFVPILLLSHTYEYIHTCTLYVHTHILRTVSSARYLVTECCGAMAPAHPAAVARSRVALKYEVLAGLRPPQPLHCSGIDCRVTYPRLVSLAKPLYYRRHSSEIVWKVTRTLQLFDMGLSDCVEVVTCIS